MVHGCMVYTERAETAAVSFGAMGAEDIEKCSTKKAIHSYRITCERSETPGERRTALYKSDQQRRILTQSSGAV